MTAVSHQARPWRWAPLVVLVVAAIALVVVLRGSGAHHYRVVFATAGQLVKGDRVRIGGTPAGTITSIELTKDGQAEIGVKVDERFGPLREGTTATIRQIGLTSVAGRYVDISPAPTFRPALDDDATISGDKTTPIVDLDQLFNMLDAPTRKGLQQFIDGSASWYEGKEQEANASAKAFPAALSGLDQLAAELSADDANLTRFLVKTGDALGALSENKEQLTDLVSNTRGDDGGAERQHGVAGPGAAARRAGAAQGHRVVRRAAPRAQGAADAGQRLGPGDQGPRARTRASCARCSQQAVPTFRQLREMFAQPGASNDLLDALQELPALNKLTKTGFAEGEKSLKQGTPIFSFARPYVPDLVGWVRGFGQAMATYDANGHYARTLPVFDAYSTKRRRQPDAQARW